MKISVVDLTVGYGSNSILTGINFTLVENSLIGLIGVNGSGKTTLLETLMGEIPAISGEVTPELAGRASFLPQDVDDPPFLTVKEVVETGLHVGNAHQNVMKFLGTCEISHLHDRKFSKLSGGEKKRAWLSFILAQNRELIFLDEPFSAIDHQSKEDFYTLLRNISASGKTIFVVSHDSELISKHADQILEARENRIYEI